MVAKPRFIDVSLNWTLSPGTNDIGILTDQLDIQNSIKKIITLDKFDIPFNDSHYSNVKYLLFELPSQIVCASLTTNLTWLLGELEPRIKIQKLTVVQDNSRSGYIVTIVYNIIKLNIVDTLVTPLVRRTT